MLQVLFTSKDMNPYVGELVTGLSEFCSVTRSVEEFYVPSRNYDVIHIQWIEELFDWKTPRRETIEKALHALQKWKEKAAIVITRHNFFPHQLNDSNKEIYNQVYNSFFEHADTLIHLGNYSVREFKKRYPNTFPNLKHRVIPHHIYQSNLPGVNKYEARKLLGLPAGDKIVLVFGKIRTKVEKRFVLQTFRRLNIPGKLLFVPRWLHRSVRAGKIDAVINGVKKRFYKHVFNTVLFSKVATAEEIALYFSACDVVLVPRLHSLNSGVPFLAFAYNRPVVGPAAGNIEEVLVAAGCPVFKNFTPAAAAHAVQKAVELSEPDFTQSLADVSIQFQLQKAVKCHADLYKSTVGLVW